MLSSADQGWTAMGRMQSTVHRSSAIEGESASEVLLRPARERTERAVGRGAITPAGKVLGMALGAPQKIELGIAHAPAGVEERDEFEAAIEGQR